MKTTTTDSEFPGTQKTAHRHTHALAAVMFAALVGVACGGADDPQTDPSATSSAGGNNDQGGGGSGGGDAGGSSAANGGSSAGVGGAGGDGYGGYGGGGDIACNGPGALFVTRVTELSYGPGQDHGRDQMPDVVMGAPHGAGETQGSLHVVSLGNGGVIGVAFDGNAIVDGPGVDFVVFENAFAVGTGVFAELATVSVSDDGETWHTFPCTAVDAPYGSCAGHTPVHLESDATSVDPDSAGGDGFDLADLGVSRARFVRIEDRPDLDGFSGVFDLDAVGIVNAACP